MRLYGVLLQVGPSLGARLGHAAAVGECSGAAAGLELLARLQFPEVQNHQPYWALKAALHRDHAELDAARDAYARAIQLTDDAGVRRWLKTQADSLC